MTRSHVGKTEPFSGGVRDYASGGRYVDFPWGKGCSVGVGWVGLEPTTNALKGRCSTIELPTRAERNVLIQLGECRKTRFRRRPRALAQTDPRRCRPACLLRRGPELFEAVGGKISLGVVHAALQA